MKCRKNNCSDIDIKRNFNERRKLIPVIIATKIFPLSAVAISRTMDNNTDKCLGTVERYV
jgi:hypothetical protein